MYPVQLWRDKNVPEIIILFVIIEELVHYIWGIPNGETLNKKVIEIM